MTRKSKRRSGRVEGRRGVADPVRAAGWEGAEREAEPGSSQGAAGPSGRTIIGLSFHT